MTAPDLTVDGYAVAAAPIFISIVMPCRNEAATVGICVRNALAAIAQNMIIVGANVLLVGAMAALLDER